MTDGTIEVDVNTDNLDDFELLFNGKAAEKAPVDEDVEPAEDSGATDPVEADEPVEDTPDEDVEAEESEDEDEDDIFKPAPKKKQTAQERINDLTRARHEAERREAETLRKLAELEARINSPKDEPKPVTPVQTDGAPRPDALTKDGDLVYPLGEFDPAFIRDLTKFTIVQETAVIREQAAADAKAREDAEANRQLTTQWDSKMAKAEETFKDLRPTLATLEQTFQGVDQAHGQYLASTIMEMELGPQVLYYLANHLDEANSIVASSPARATMALGRLEAKIEAALNSKKTPQVKVSTAPPPAPVTRGNGGRVSVSDDTDDLDAFEAKFYKRK